MYSSPDGIVYDTQDLYTFDFAARAGETMRKTVELTPKVRILKVTCENLGASGDITSMKVTTTLGR